MIVCGSTRTRQNLPEHHEPRDEPARCVTRNADAAQVDIPIETSLLAALQRGTEKGKTSARKRVWILAESQFKRKEKSTT